RVVHACSGRPEGSLRDVRAGIPDHARPDGTLHSGFGQTRIWMGPGGLLMADSWIRRRVVNPFIDLLKQGITPEKLALTVARGVTIGAFPVLGSTTILCGIASWALKLNIPAMQLVNYLVYPLQLALLIPFLRIGSSLFGSGELNLTLPEVFALIRGDLWHAV